jgi:hypothetical protein
LVWEEDLASRSLLDVVIVGIGPIFSEERRPRATDEVDASLVLDVLDRDPAAWRDARDEQPPPPAARDNRAATDSDDEDRGHFLAGVPEDFVADVVEIAMEAAGLDGDVALDVEEALSAADAVIGETPSDDDLEASLAAHAGQLSSAGAAAPIDVVLPNPPVPEALRHAVIDANGFVTCPTQEPWCQYDQLGRITSWPANKEGDKWNKSCKCKMHLNCSTPARNRDLFPDEMLLTWLFMGKCEPMCTRGRSMELAKEHKQVFAIVADNFRRPAAGASASSSGPS